MKTFSCGISLEAIPSDMLVKSINAVIGKANSTPIIITSPNFCERTMKTSWLSEKITGSFLKDSIINV